MRSNWKIERLDLRRLPHKQRQWIFNVFSKIQKCRSIDRIGFQTVHNTNANEPIEIVVVVADAFPCGIGIDFSFVFIGAYDQRDEAMSVTASLVTQSRYAQVRKSNISATTANLSEGIIYGIAELTVASSLTQFLKIHVNLFTLFRKINAKKRWRLI